MQILEGPWSDSKRRRRVTPMVLVAELELYQRQTAGSLDRQDPSWRILAQLAHLGVAGTAWFGRLNFGCPLVHLIRAEKIGVANGPVILKLKYFMACLIAAGWIFWTGTVR